MPGLRCLSHRPLSSLTGQGASQWKLSSRQFARPQQQPSGPRYSSHFAPRRRLPLSNPPCRPKTLSTIPCAVRYASTDQNTPVPKTTSSTTESPSNEYPSLPPDASEFGAPTPTEDVYGLDSRLEDALSTAPAHIEEYSGWLKDLGLDYGWGTTVIMETILENIHMHLGLPWWASIIGMLCVTRGLLFKLYLNSTDSAARLSTIKVLTEPIDKKMKAAREREDYLTMRSAQMEKKAIVEKAAVGAFRAFLPMIVQIPLGIGTFRLLRGMAELPVPGFDEGGFLWLSNLTIPDPFFIMPLVSGAVMMLTFKLGSETGATSQLSGGQKQIFLFVIPIGTTLFASFWPAALQLSIVWGSSLALLQGRLFRWEAFRKFAKLQPWPKPGDQNYRGPLGLNTAKAAQEERDEAIGMFKNAVNDMRRSANDIMDAPKKARAAQQAAKEREGPTRSKAEIKKAKEYEQTKARQAAQKRFVERQDSERRADDKRIGRMRRRARG